MPIDPARTGRDALNAGFDPTRATPPPLLGIVKDEFGDVQVHRERDGSVVLWAPDAEWSTSFTPAERDKLRELLDRAAMPGQAQAVTDGGVLMCATPGDCPNGPEPHAFIPDNEEVLPCCRQPWEPPALTVAAVSPALAERMGEIADAAQEVPPCPAP